VGGAAAIGTAEAASTPEWISGQISGRDGAAASGATVALFAESPEVVQLKTGQSAQMPLVASAKADVNGNYTLALPASFDPGAFADPAGIVTFTAVAQDGAFVQSDEFQRQVDASSGTARLVAVGSAKSVKPFAARSSTARDAVTGTPITLSFDMGSPDTEQVTKVPISRSGQTDVNAMSTSVSVKEDYGSRWAYVGQWSSALSGVTAKFHYKKSASSSLGVAVSATGGAGTFKADGTKSRSSDATVGFAKRSGKGDVKFRTQFHYQKRFYQTCTAGWTCSSKYKIEPMSWRGGADTLSRTNPSATKCVPQEKGSDHSQASTKAYKFKAGVANSGMTVVDLSTQSGFSSTVKQNIHFSKAGKLCGRSGYPGSSPQVLAAKPS
jgi:hypothetical protein